MSYTEDYTFLKNIFNQNEHFITIPESDLKIINIPFESYKYTILPSEDEFIGVDHNTLLNSYKSKIDLSNPIINKILYIIDSKVKENRYFKYSIVKKNTHLKSKEIIILLHGLNEKNWNKYLPWAKILLELTGKTVVLFPIAFHMNRAPLEWSNSKPMNSIYKERIKLFPNIVKSSFANAAISTRLQVIPHRFFWSGLETYYDIIQLVTEIKSGNHPYIDKDASVDFFSYSIGSFLSEIILMSNHDDMFNNSRLFIFCGGPTLNRMSPVSKYIMDSEAKIAIYSFFIEHLEKEIERDEKLSYYFEKSHTESVFFKCMLDYYKMIDLRENKLLKLKDQIFALALKKDTVIPGYEVLNTLKGENRKIPIKTRIIDFPYNYIHENPFPISDKIKSEVNRSFRRVFNCAANFLS